MRPYSSGRHARTVAFNGDSLLYGVTVAPGVVDTPSPLHAFRLLNNPTYAPSNRVAPKRTNGLDPDQGGFINQSAGGLQMQDIIVPTTSTFQPDVTVIYAGTNDIIFDGGTLVALQNATAALNTALIASGTKPVFCTVIAANQVYTPPDPRAGALAAFNAWLLGGALPGALISDVAAAPEFIDPNDLLYFQVGGIHLTQLGYDAMGREMAPTIAAAITFGPNF